MRDRENQSGGREIGHRQLLRWGLVAAIFAACAYFLDLGSVVEVLSRISVGWLFLLFGLMTVDRFLMAWKWSLLLAALGLRVGYGSLIRIYYQGTLAGVFLPSGIGGDLLRAHLVSSETGAVHQVYASLIMEKMIGLLSAANWGLIGLALLLSQVRELPLVLTATLMASVLLLNVVFFLSLGARFDELFLQSLEKLPYFRIPHFLEGLRTAYREYGNKRAVLVWNGSLTVAEHALQLLVALVMATGLGLVHAIVPFLAVTAVYLLIYRVPISPDGWGLGEVAAIALYGFIGLTSESAFGMAFLAHIMQVLVVLPGAWFFCRSESIKLLTQSKSVPS